MLLAGRVWQLLRPLFYWYTDRCMWDVLHCMNCTELYCAELSGTVPKCSVLAELYWTALNCNEPSWTVLSCTAFSALYWNVQNCTKLYWTVLFWSVPNCTELSWTVDIEITELYYAEQSLTVLNCIILNTRCFFPWHSDPSVLFRQLCTASLDCSLLNVRKKSIITYVNSLSARSVSTLSCQRS